MSRLALLLGFLITLSAQAKTFSNSFISFEIPDDWNCLLEGPTWVCSPRLSKDAREAIITINAKVTGPEDTLANYTNYLSKPRNITSPKGIPITSQIMGEVGAREIGGQQWVRAQHLSSEIPDFYTLYLVTTKSQLAILATFSVERSKTANYNPIFDKAVRSLKIVASQELLIAKGADAGGTPQGVIGIETSQSMGVADSVPPMPQKSNAMIFVFLGAILAAVAAFVIYKRR